MAVPRQGCGCGSKLLEFPPSLVRSHVFRKDSFGPLDPSGRIITTRGRADRLLAGAGRHGPLSFLPASSAMVTPKASAVAAAGAPRERPMTLETRSGCRSYEVSRLRAAATTKSLRDHSGLARVRLGSKRVGCMSTRSQPCGGRCPSTARRSGRRRIIPRTSMMNGIRKCSGPW